MDFVIEESIDYKNYHESIISLFTIDKGKVKILLVRKQTEPYRGYWILPSDFVPVNQTLEGVLQELVYDKIGYQDFYMEQCHTFSRLDRDPDDRVIATSYIGLLDSTTAILKREERPEVESAWFDINEIPKVGYDHEEVIRYSIDRLRSKIVNSTVLKSLFPSDFTLPEIQKVYEEILGVHLDRRNFRKKFINLGLIEDTGYKNEGMNGRPAKLYRFKENVKERNLF